jgi:hypothetical protein
MVNRGEREGREDNCRELTAESAKGAELTAMVNRGEREGPRSCFFLICIEAKSVIILKALRNARLTGL